MWPIHSFLRSPRSLITLSTAPKYLLLPSSFQQLSFHSHTLKRAPSSNEASIARQQHKNQKQIEKTLIDLIHNLKKQICVMHGVHSLSQLIDPSSHHSNEQHNYISQGSNKQGHVLSETNQSIALRSYDKIDSILNDYLPLEEATNGISHHHVEGQHWWWWWSRLITKKPKLLLDLAVMQAMNGQFDRCISCLQAVHDCLFSPKYYYHEYYRQNHANTMMSEEDDDQNFGSIPMVKNNKHRNRNSDRQLFMTTIQHILKQMRIDERTRREHVDRVKQFATRYDLLSKQSYGIVNEILSGLEREEQMIREMEGNSSVITEKQFCFLFGYYLKKHKQDRAELLYSQYVSQKERRPVTENLMSELIRIAIENDHMDLAERISRDADRMHLSYSLHEKEQIVLAYVGAAQIEKAVQYSISNVDPLSCAAYTKVLQEMSRKSPKNYHDHILKMFNYLVRRKLLDDDLQYYDAMGRCLAMIGDVNLLLQWFDKLNSHETLHIDEYFVYTVIHKMGIANHIEKCLALTSELEERYEMIPSIFLFSTLLGHSNNLSQVLGVVEHVQNNDIETNNDWYHKVIRALLAHSSPENNNRVSFKEIFKEVRGISSSTVRMLEKHLKKYNWSQKNKQPDSYRRSKRISRPSVPDPTSDLIFGIQEDLHDIAFDQVYTDAAFRSEQQSGGGGIVFVDHERVVYRLPFRIQYATSSNYCELYSVAVACLVAPPNQHLDIYCDNDNVCKQNHGDHYCKELQEFVLSTCQDKNLSVAYSWVKGHSDNYLNVQSDELANIGSHSPDLVL